MAKNLTFAIVPGIGEGRLISWRMSQALTAAGYVETDPRQADIIITHSGGIYVVPSDIRAGLFAHIIITHYMPYGQLLAAHRRKVVYDFRLRWQRGQVWRGGLALLANGWYLLNITRGLATRRGFLHSGEVLADLPPGRHLFIGGINDGLSDASVIVRDTLSRHTYLSIYAGHDDCWRTPEPYVQTLQTMIDTD